MKAVKILVFLMIVGFGQFEVRAKKNKVELPFGKYQYIVKANNTKIGSAFITIKKEKKQILTSAELSIQINNVVTITQEFLRETENLDPVKYVSITKVIAGNQVQREKVSVDFKGKQAIISSGSYKRKVNLKGKFVLGTNYFIKSLLKQKMKTNASAKKYVYDPSIEEDEVIPVLEKVLGKKTVEINNKKVELFHTVQNYGNIKNIQNYYDSKGLVYKSVINMLNTTIEMTLEK